jgi:hypothetical protein
VVFQEKYRCTECPEDKVAYMSKTFSYYAVCILDDKRTTGQYYVVARKDLYNLNRAVHGSSTEAINPVSGEVYYSEV